MFTKMQLTSCKVMLGKEVTVTLAVKNEEGIHPPDDNQPASEEKIKIKLTGIFGKAGQPLFIVGKKEDGQEIAFRNVHWFTAEEERCIPNFWHEAKIKALDEIDLLKIFEEAYQCHETNIKHLLGYRKENVQGQLVSLNWGTGAVTIDSEVIKGIKQLERIV